MEVVKAQTWKKLVEQVDIAKKSAKYEPSAPKSKWGVNTKKRATAQSS